MKRKTMRLKYPKDPRILLDKSEVEAYICNLEEVGELDKLPLPFLTYYVIGCVLTGEVNNGGFEQYLSNSSVKTISSLERCVKAIDNKELTAIVMEFLSAVSKEFDIKDTQALAKADYSEKLEFLLSELDSRFYEFDQKYDVNNITKKYYQQNIPEEKLIFEIVKPKETNRLRFFVYDNTGITNEEAAKAYMAFLAEFTNIKFDIQIDKWIGMFRVTAIDRTNSLVLEQIFKHFDDPSYSFGKNNGTNRCKMLGFNLGGGILDYIYISAFDEENWNWLLKIEKSEFENNEYKLSHIRFFSGCSGIDKHVSRIGAGDFKDDAMVIDTMEKIFIECAKAQGNINCIYEEINSFDTTGNNVKNILFEK